jgi:hypothetical protein
VGLGKKDSYRLKIDGLPSKTLGPHVRKNPYRYNRLFQDLKTVAWAEAKRARIPPLEGATVQLTFIVHMERVRDDSNWLCRAGAIFDGLKAAGVIKDDSEKYLTHLKPEYVVDKGQRPGVIVDIWKKEVA